MFTIRAAPADPAARSVVFTIDGRTVVNDMAPFTLDASAAGAAATSLQPDTRSISATAFSGPGGTGRALDAQSATVEVVGEPGGMSTGPTSPEERPEFNVEGKSETEAEAARGVAGAATASGATATAFGSDAVADTPASGSLTLAINGVDGRIVSDPTTSEGQSGSGTRPVGGDGPLAGGEPPVIDISIVSAEAEVRAGAAAASTGLSAAAVGADVILNEDGTSGVVATETATAIHGASSTQAWVATVVGEAMFEPVAPDPLDAGVPGPDDGTVVVEGGEGPDASEPQSDADDAALVLDGEAEVEAGFGVVAAAAGAGAAAAGFAAQVVSTTDTATGELGTVFGDVVTGTAQAETLLGGVGIDLLRGLAGDDMLLGEAGNDQIQGSFGDDLLVGGEGADTADVSDIAAGDLLLQDTSGVVFARDRCDGETDILIDVERIATAAGTVEAADVGTFDGLSFIASNPELIERLNGLGPRALVDAAAATFISAPVGTFDAPTFSAENFLQANPDLLQELGLDPVAATLEFIEQGFDQGRPTGAPQEPDFAAGPVLGPEPGQAGNQASVVAMDAPQRTTDQPFSFLIPSYAFIDPDLGDTLTLDMGRLPTGLGFDNGRITGTPVEAGTFQVRVTATDQAGLAANQFFDLEITETPLPPDQPTQNQQPVVPLPIDFQRASTQEAFSLATQENTSADPDQDQMPTITVSDLPAGPLFENGAITGTPQATGTFTISVTATDPGGLAAVEEFQLQVVDRTLEPDMPMNSAPQLVTPLADQDATVGRSFAFNIPQGAFADPDPDTDLSFTASALPPGLAFKDDRIVGTPTQAGAREITVTATVEAGLAATDTFVIDVGAMEPGPGDPMAVTVGQGGRGFATLTTEGTASAATLTFDQVDDSAADFAELRVQVFLDGERQGGIGGRLRVDEPGGTFEVAERHGREFDEIRVADATSTTTALVTEAIFDAVAGGGAPGGGAAVVDPEPSGDPVATIAPGGRCVVSLGGGGDAASLELTPSQVEAGSDDVGRLAVPFFEEGAFVGRRRGDLSAAEPGETVTLDLDGTAFDQVRLRDADGDVPAVIEAVAFFDADGVAIDDTILV